MDDYRDMDKQELKDRETTIDALQDEVKGCSQRIDQQYESITHLRSQLANAQWALMKVFGFVPEGFETGWTDEVQEAIDKARVAVEGNV